jgi:peroxiredoxin
MNKAVFTSLYRSFTRRALQSLLLSSSALLGAMPALAAPERVSDFAMLDYQGEFHQLSRYLHREALVLMSYDRDCPAMPELVQAYNEFSESWEQAEGREVSFVLMDSKDLGREVMAEVDLPMPLLEDMGQLVSESLEIQKAGEVLAFDPERTTLLYRGPVDGGLDTALEDFLDGGIENTLTAAVEGCDIDYNSSNANAGVPDYASEVAPIIIEKCAECHRQDGVGPFAMDSHIMVMGWSPMIREVLLNRRMPPTQVDPYLGHSRHARYLDREQLQTLIHWIDAGAPRGESEEDPLENLDFSHRKEWLLGEPDYIVKGPAIDIPSTGVMDYSYEFVDLPFEEDRWVRAVQYMAGDESVLHHLMTYVVPPEEDFWGPEAEQTSVSRRFLEGYAPGTIEAVEFPEDTGVLIPAGHRLAMQFHYVTNGRSTVDETQLGLYFYDEPPKYEKRTQVVGAQFTLPPEVNDFQLQADHQFDEEVVIVGLRAHMHYRGKRMKFSATLPDGEMRDLFSVPAYNYGWQPHYLLTDPVTLPAGSTVHVIGALDNSESNPNNPNPESEVPFGIYSRQEMFTGYWTYYIPD